MPSRQTHADKPQSSDNEGVPSIIPPGFDGVFGDQADRQGEDHADGVEAQVEPEFGDVGPVHATFRDGAISGVGRFFVYFLKCLNYFLQF